MNIVAYATLLLNSCMVQIILVRKNLLKQIFSYKRSFWENLKWKNQSLSLRFVDDFQNWF